MNPMSTKKSQRIDCAYDELVETDKQAVRIDA
jgi:hypothetical protein